MKRLLLFLILLMGMVISVNAQKLIVDKADANGVRSILSEGDVLFDNKDAIAMFNLGCIALQGKAPSYSLYLQIGFDKLRIDEGRKLLIKFSDDSIIELENVKRIGPADYTSHVGKYETIYYVFPYYHISEEQIQEIITKEVVKVRIEYNTGVVDGEILKNAFSKLMTTMYDNIKEALSVKKDVYSDF